MPTIEVFADVTCPFTHVGLRRWVARRAELGRIDVRLRVKAWPLELVNGAPLTGEFVGHEIDDLQAQVCPDLFAGFAPDRFPHTTLGALRLTTAAYAVDAETGEAVALELRDRLFERGQDVSDGELLSAMSQAHGIPSDWAIVGVSPEADTVAAEWAEGRRRGVIGSPHFFGPGLNMFCPSLRIQREGEHLNIALSGDGFEELSLLSFGEMPAGSAA